MKMPLFLILFIPGLLYAQDDALAKKCGSEVKWAASLEKAKHLSSETRKPVFWYVYTVSGTKMDRKDVVDNYMMMGPFMSPAVIEVLNKHFVPVRARAEGRTARDFGIKKLDFIEPGVIFINPAGGLIHKMDRLYTYNEEWFLDQMFLALKRNPFRKELRTEKDPVKRARLYRLLREPKKALTELKKAGDSDAAKLERGLINIKLHQYRNAEKFLRDLAAPRAQYLYGCVLHLTLRDKEAVAVWKRVEKGGGRWAWKAAAELRRLGPFSRAFEEIGYLPDDAYGKRMSTTDRPRTAKEIKTLVRRGIDFLLKHQKSSGVWNDSNYDFGGKASLPDVYVAGTALTALALYLWRDVYPERIDAALKLADKYLENEGNISEGNKQERVWAHLYRLIYWAARKKPEKKIDEVVATLRKMQKESGIWYHEYSNPFVSASILHALHEVKQAGFKVDAAVLRRGARSVSACRHDDGIYSYGYPKRRAPIQSAAGRMPICEYALFVNKLAKVGDVRKAIAKAFEYHHLRERVRKYDDHADRWQNGGFFFYYDLFGISYAADALPKTERKKIHKQLMKIVLSIGEIDGSWQDSHELGKTYGTSVALILIKRARASR